MKALINKLTILSRITALILGLFFFYFAMHLHQKKHCIVIGAKNCTEQHILGEILAQLIEKKTDLKVTRCFNLEGTTICFNALKSGAIDLYFEYTGTALLDILKEPLRPGPLLPYLRKKFEENYNVFWLEPLGFCNQYSLIARSNSKWKKLSDLDPSLLRVAFDPEFASRKELQLLKNTYPSKWSYKLMDQMLLYLSLEKGGVDVISGASTDGLLFKEIFTTLEDDLQCLPRYEIAPLVSKKVLNKCPQLKIALSLLEGVISEQIMSNLNYQVEILKKDPKKVAINFLNML